jgi:cyclic-di-GMP-binding biofilm dispersal mediator protein
MSVQPAPAGHHLRGASVLLAGASGGLGRALAAELHERGAMLTLVGRRMDRLEAVGVPASLHEIDLESASGCDAAIEAAMAASKRLNVVINAIGVVPLGPVGELSDEVLEQLFRTNVFLPMMLARAALERIDPGGAVVNISGVVAERPQASGREVRGIKVRVLGVHARNVESGLAGRPLEGIAAALPDGSTPELVASVICDALEGDPG